MKEFSVKRKMKAFHCLKNYDSFKLFFLVLVILLYDLTLVDKKDRDNKTNLTPRQQLNAIFKATLPLYEKRDEIFNNIIQKLRKRQIVRYKFDELSMVRKQYISKYFYEEVMPLLSAQIIDPHQPFPHLINKSLYIYSMLDVPDNIDDEKSTQNLIMGLISVPSTLPRYIMFPGTNEFILLEDLILNQYSQIIGLYIKRLLQ